MRGEPTVPSALGALEALGPSFNIQLTFNFRMLTLGQGSRARSGESVFPQLLVPNLGWRNEGQVMSFNC